MGRWLFSAGFTLALFTICAEAQDGPRRGKITKLDLAQHVVVLAVGGKDEEFQLAEDARVLGVSGRNLQERFAGIREGAEVFFKATTRDGQPVIVAVKAAEGGARQPAVSMPRVESDKLVPLTALGKERYQGFEGGLYPDGKNERPADHEAAGLALAKQVQLLDGKG
ncbi:MAG: hypothetical protein JJ992_17560, partial [Planctomycetes bacterium]|nr:hypothetical protein [Planctomycetota bacterium]